MPSSYRLKTIECREGVYASSFRLTMSDGTQSPLLGGVRKPNEIYEVPEDARIERIKCFGINLYNEYNEYLIREIYLIDSKQEIMKRFGNR